MAQSIPTETIIAQLQRGENIDSITRYLYSTYERALKGYTRKLGASPDDAQDLIQEVMITFLRQVLSGQYEPREHVDLSAYLIGIARRKWLKTIESENRRQQRQYRFVAGNADPETPEEVVMETDYRVWAWEHFQKLGEICRQILTAFYQDEQSLEYIADQYELGTVGAAKMRKFRCVQKLLKLTEI